MNLRGKISHIGHFLSKHAPYTVSNEGESRDTSVILLYDISNGVVLESNCFYQCYSEKQDQTIM